MDDQIRQVKTGRELSSLDRVPNPAVPLPPHLAGFVSDHKLCWYPWLRGNVPTHLLGNLGYIPWLHINVPMQLLLSRCTHQAVSM